MDGRLPLVTSTLNQFIHVYIVQVNTHFRYREFSSFFVYVKISISLLI
uniref:Uncharacterized protein n=1 Tax=Rhizophora mucronata TaxID=61149 RepID=A0A2P2LFC0_RHIMU